MVVFALPAAEEGLGWEGNCLGVELVEGLPVLGVHGFGQLLLLGLSPPALLAVFWAFLLLGLYVFHIDNLSDVLILDDDVGLWTAVVDGAGVVTRGHCEGKLEVLLQIGRWIPHQMFLLISLSRLPFRLLNPPTRTFSPSWLRSPSLGLGLALSLAELLLFIANYKKRAVGPFSNGAGVQA